MGHRYLYLFPEIVYIAPVGEPLISRPRRRADETPLQRARRAVAESLLSKDRPRRPSWRPFWIFTGWLLVITVAVIALWLR